MKKLKRILLVSTAILLFAVADSSAQLVVRVRPNRGHLVARPARPSAGHIWVGDEWVVRGRGYVRRPGYWAVAPRPRAVWVEGHWDRRPRGYVWVPGRWR
jgi:hypothetical protein